MLPWLEKHSRIQAEYINLRTRDEISLALQEPDPREAVKSVFLAAVTVWVVEQAVTAVTSVLNFGSVEGARAGGLKTKTWQTNSKNPRPAHLRMDGETVGVRDSFSNGMRWPGDPAGGAENNANCGCSVRFA